MPRSSTLRRDTRFILTAMHTMPAVFKSCWRYFPGQMADVNNLSIGETLALEPRTTSVTH